MECSRVQELMSAYYDNELSADLRRDVAEHLRGCSSCAEELAYFERLSQMTAQLEVPTIPAETWDRIEDQLRPDPNSASRIQWWGRFAMPRSAVAASVLILAGLALWIGTMQVQPRSANDHGSEVNLAPYARKFYQDPSSAQKMLLANYTHSTVTPEQAEQELKYRPALAETLPGGFVRRELRLVAMPCCTCLQAVYRNDASEQLATFQQSSDDTFLFDGCAGVDCMCGGVETRLVEVDGGVVANWAANGTHMTLVGARDIGQVVAAIETLVTSTGVHQE